MPVQVEKRKRIAVRLTLRGQVQGRGVRPAIARHAAECAVTGIVRNTRAGLEVVAEGIEPALKDFCSRLATALPPGCELDTVDKESIPATGHTVFEILRDQSDGPLDTPVPRDISVCGQCLADIVDPDDRRYRYPLTSCAACGPRYTIIRRMPYERADTSMGLFSLCADCKAEYLDPRDRRFHAQTTACSFCGPRVWVADSDGGVVGSRDDAIETCVATLRAGKIVALKGIGGYQLLCDATCDDIVRRLRVRKRRPLKPLAVLVQSLQHAHQLAFISPSEATILTSSANPIVLLRARDGSRLSREIHPGLNEIGLMLPTTPLHALIASAFGSPLVCTSANKEGEPLEYEVQVSQQVLAGIADLWLHHDRPIERPIDDSVVRVMADRTTTLRLARGSAPLPLELSTDEPLLALGGHQKVAVAWSNGRQTVLGPHIGDMETLPARERYVEAIENWERLYGFAPSRVVHDLHPDYFTTHRAAETNLPTLAVQHHVAHVTAAMLEHRLLDRKVLGIAWDGTGFGTGGTVWGGEFLLVNRACEFERVAHLRPFSLVGGEAAIREPGRVSVALLREAVGEDELLRGRILGMDVSRTTRILAMLQKPRLSVQCTSAGRLFDAAAAIIFPMESISFDGQPAMMLEAIADRSSDGRYSLPLITSRPMQLDWRPMFAELWNDNRCGISPGVISMRFHRALASGIVDVIRRYAEMPAVLAGGVFQNRLLTELVVELLNDCGNLGLPGAIPVNDGGLAAGQLAIAVQSGPAGCRGRAKQCNGK